MAGYVSGVDDISRAHPCPRCQAWVPDAANFCGQCGQQQRALPTPREEALQIALQEIEQRYRRRRRRAIALGLGAVSLLILAIQEDNEKRRVWQTDRTQREQGRG